MATPLADSLRPFVESGFVAGAVLAAADRDKTLAVEAVGSADLASGAPMRADTLFWIASMTKPMTAAAVMMAVDAGKLALDDPAAKYLPGFGGLLVQPESGPARPPARPVTVRDLLSHVSGLPFAAPAEERYKDALTPAEGGLVYSRLRLQADPGTAYAYSNVGINAAAAVLEAATGEEYEAFLAARLLEPLGMRDTLFRPAGERLARVAKTYKANAAKDGLEETPIDQLRYPLDDPTRAAMAGGGLFSTAADVLRFGRMILRGGELDGRRYLSGSAVGELTRRQTAPSLETAYGLGFGVSERGFGHGGALWTNLWIDPALDLVRVFLVQQAGEWPGGVGDRIRPAFERAAEALVGGAAREAAAAIAGSGTPPRG